MTEVNELVDVKEFKEDVEAKEFDVKESKEVKTFIFSSHDSDKKFEVSQEVAKLSSLFKSMIESDNNENSVTLEPLTQVHEDSEKKFTINTTFYLEYVYKYFKIWESNPAKANYVQVVPIQTNDLLHVLQQCDIDLIQSFIIAAGSTLNDRRKNIEILGEFLCQVDEFLGIESFENKIYAYIAVLIWNTSAVDFAEAMKDLDFKAAQEKALEEWKNANPDHFSNYIKSHTTDGTPVIAPAVDKIIQDNLNPIEEIVINGDDDGNNDSDSEDNSESEPEAD